MASCDFWSVTHPHKRTRYNLTVLANPQEDEQILLPRVPPTKGMVPLAPDSIDWPCVDTEIGEEDSTNSGRGHWSSLSPITHIILTPSLLQAAYEFLKVTLTLSFLFLFSSLPLIFVILYAYIHVSCKNYFFYFRPQNVILFQMDSSLLKFPRKLQQKLILQSPIQHVR